LRPVAPDTGWETLDLVHVDYEPLPAVFDPEEALKEGSPPLYDDKPGNISSKSVWGI